MGAGLAEYAAPRPWAPLALTLGLHLLLALAWVASAPAPLPEPAQRASTLVLVQSLLRPPAPPSPPPPVLPRPRARQPEASIAPVQEAAPITIPSSSTPEPESAPPPGAATPALPGDLLASAKAMAGRADRQLRKGSSSITAEPDRKWEGFADAFAAARTGAPPGVTLESYEAPDGVTIYRKTVAGRTACYRSGSVGGLVTGFGNADLHGAGRATCPTNVSWTRQ